MDCQEARSRLYPFLDQALESPERLAVEKHLAACPDCRDRFDRSAAIDRRAVDAVRRAAVPPGLAEAVGRRLDAPGGEAARRVRLRRLALAAALLLVAGAGLLPFLLPEPSPEPIPFGSFSRFVIAFHREQEEVPTESLEFRTEDPADLEDQLARALGFHACVPDPAAAGGRLRGAATGRLECRGRPRVGYVRYERGGVRIGHLDLLDPGVALEDAYLAPVGDRRLYVYQDGSVVVVAVPIGGSLCLYVAEGVPRDEAVELAAAMMGP